MAWSQPGIALPPAETLAVPEGCCLLSRSRSSAMLDVSLEPRVSLSPISSSASNQCSRPFRRFGLLLLVRIVAGDVPFNYAHVCSSPAIHDRLRRSACLGRFRHLSHPRQLRSKLFGDMIVCRFDYFPVEYSCIPRESNQQE